MNIAKRRCAAMRDALRLHSSSDEEVVTFGVAWQPIDQLIVKLDYMDFDEAVDQWNLAFGYIF